LKTGARDAGIAIIDLQQGWMLSAGGGLMFPQQSVAKLWTAVAALDAVDSGRVRLEDEIGVGQGDLSVFHQPLAARIGPEGSPISVSELLSRAIVDSDNAANDILVRALGGREKVQAVIQAKGLTDITAGLEQRILQNRIAGVAKVEGYPIGAGFLAARARVSVAVRRQALDAYLAAPYDGATPEAVVRALVALYRGQLLSPSSTAYLLGLLGRTRYGHDRLEGGLAPGWRIAHKTGTGPVLGPVRAGENDVGLLTAPDGRTYAVAVFIGRTRLPEAEGAQLMREVARAIVDQWSSGA